MEKIHHGSNRRRLFGLRPNIQDEGCFVEACNRVAVQELNREEVKTFERGQTKIIRNNFDSHVT